MIDDVFLGSLIRNYRRQNGSTLAEVATRTGLSKGLLSRVENGHVSPSLSTLSKIADALDVHISDFFLEDGVADISYLSEKEYQKVHWDDQDAVYDYYPLVAPDFGRRLFNPFMIHIKKKDFRPITNTASCDQFVYMLKGTIDYGYGQKVYTITAGDSLFFRGEMAHGPKKLHTNEAKYIMVLCRRTPHK